jgi:prepilin signal peptidase PulO-like enzyme (type II secretory pathway)
MLTMIALSILSGLLLGLVVNLAADSLSTHAPLDGQKIRFSPGAPVCPACGKPRSPVAWSGLLALLSGRRHCPSCSAPLSWRHVLVELALIALGILVWTPLGAQVVPSASLAKILYTLYGAILILVLVTDIEHRLVPHAVMLPAIGLALLAAFVNPAWDSPTRALLGGALGLICGLAMYGGGALFARLLGRLRGEPISETAFGFGDVTLLTFLGLVVGAPEILLALCIGVLGGGVCALAILIVRGRIRKQHALLTTIPYAPFLILGGASMLVFGPAIMAWYLRGR